MSEPMTFQKKSRRERYIVRDDMSMGYKKDILLFLRMNSNSYITVRF